MHFRVASIVLNSDYLELKYKMNSPREIFPGILRNFRNYYFVGELMENYFSIQEYTRLLTCLNFL